jgi:hypothetical protein
MNVRTILEFVVSDVLTASAISGIFLLISDKAQKNQARQAERHLEDMKDHIDLRLEVIESHLKEHMNKKE